MYSFHKRKGEETYTTTSFFLLSKVQTCTIPTLLTNPPLLMQKNYTPVSDKIAAVYLYFAISVLLQFILFS